jgi:hypothetical protein
MPEKLARSFNQGAFISRGSIKSMITLNASGPRPILGSLSSSGELVEQQGYQPSALSPDALRDEYRQLPK